MGNSLPDTAVPVTANYGTGTSGDGVSSYFMDNSVPPTTAPVDAFTAFLMTNQKPILWGILLLVGGAILYQKNRR